MALGNVTREAVLAAVREFDEIGRDAFLDRHGFGRAREYFLIHEGRSYDSKAIVGAAHGIARPDLGAWTSSDFIGGEATVGRLLTSLGFEMSGANEGASERATRNPSWTRDELILALDYYLSNPGESHDPASDGVLRLSAEVNATARLLGLTGSDTLRNANGVSMKLLNFRAHDPAYTSRGRTGLSRGNRLEAELWADFAEHPEGLRAIADAVRRRLTAPEPDVADAISVGDEPEVAEALEGRLITRLHRFRERDRGLVKRKKAEFVRRHGQLFCEACGFSFEEKYGERGRNFIECHHIWPVAFLKPGEATKLKDLAMLCANCHRMVHIKAPWLSLDELRSAIRVESVPVRGC